MVLATVLRLLFFFLVNQVALVLGLVRLRRKMAVDTLDILVSIPVHVVAREVVWCVIDRLYKLLLRREIAFANDVSAIVRVAESTAFLTGVLLFTLLVLPVNF